MHAQAHFNCHKPNFRVFDLPTLYEPIQHVHKTNLSQLTANAKPYNFIKFSCMQSQFKHNFDPVISYINSRILTSNVIISITSDQTGN